MPDGARVCVTGMGVVTSIAPDTASFIEALRAGRSGIARLARIPTDRIEVKIGAEVAAHDWLAAIERFSRGDADLAPRARKILARVPPSIRLSASAAAEALAQSGLLRSAVPPERIGLVVAGSNLHQSYVHDNRVRFQQENAYLHPTYALYYSDTSQVGCLSELFDIRGMGYIVGGASASGNVALHQASLWIRHGVLDACVVVGAASDFSEVELQGFSILGAACGEPWNATPAAACRPFDRARAGFVFGEGSACVVLENLAAARARDTCVLGELRGSAMLLDANAHPNPSLAGEQRVIRLALESAGLQPDDIGYLNAHGSASVVGDETECAAIAAVFADHLDRLPVNSTKSLVGHCMSAAGVVEFVATLLQLNHRFLHPNLNLVDPLTDRLHFAGATAQPLDAPFAVSNSFGFGGINTSLVLARG